MPVAAACAPARAWALDEASRQCPGADADVWRGHLCWMLVVVPDPGWPYRGRLRRLADADAEMPDEACVRAAVREALRERATRRAAPYRA